MLGLEDDAVIGSLADGDRRPGSGGQKVTKAVPPFANAPITGFRRGISIIFTSPS